MRQKKSNLRKKAKKILVPITAKLVSNYSWLSRAPKVTSFDVDVKL
jgi:hypothetical protein